MSGNGDLPKGNGNWDASGRSHRPRPRVPLLPLHRQQERSLLDVTETLRGKRFVVVGGTGFLGKVLIGLLLKRYPDIGHIYLMVRPKTGLSPQERFLQELWPSPCFDPMREGRNEFEAIQYLYEKLTPIAGDVTLPLAGIDAETLKQLETEGVDAVLNVAGVVSFTPPIDDGFQVNAQGVLNLIDLCRHLGPFAPTAPKSGNGAEVAPDSELDNEAPAIPLLHTSTCYVAGGRTGTIFEDDPREWPFPRCDEIDPSHWDASRELEQGLELAREIHARANDAQLESRFVERAKRRLREQQRPTQGEVLKSAIKKEKSRWLDEQLVEAGSERAKHWGWPNTYVYTKSVGEQLLAQSGIPFTIVRPAVVESSLSFPFPGWNEGINTSAPLIYMALHGQVQYPTRDGHILDIIPVDQVCFGTVLAMAALVAGEHEAVYQFGTSDANGLTMNRLIELTGLYKRRFMRSRRRGNPLLNRLYARVEPVAISPEAFYQRSSPAILKGLGVASKGISLLKKTPAAPVAAPLAKSVRSLSKQAKGAQMVMEAFLPFISQLDYRFRCDHTRALYQRTTPEDQERLPFIPQELDWRSYWHEVHIPGLRKWVFPHLEARLFKRPRAEERFSDLVSLLDEVSDREGSRVALQRLENGSEESRVLDGVTYRDLKSRAYACASRLADVGVHPGDRVGLVAQNSPEWAIAFFGILCAGASVVPLDPKLDSGEQSSRLEKLGVEFALLGNRVAEVERAACLDLHEFVSEPVSQGAITAPEVLISPDDVAMIPFTAGTMGDAKPVVLTHKNLTAVLASVAPLFKITRRDSGLSVMPLHQTFELACGLLLPLLRGAKVTYVDDCTTEQLSEAFQVAGITAMIGVPQVWQDLEKRIYDDLSESGPFAEAAFEAGLLLNRTLGKALGVNLGRVLFRPVHDRLGGKIRFMVSTGGHLPAKTADMFRTLGLELRQGYGLTEAAPVVSVGDAKGRGRVVPGLEVEVRDVADDGVGEIVARGDTVMQGYFDDEETTQQVFGPDGWLRTGDLGRIDGEGRITVVARHNEVITLPSGERVYPRPIEEHLAKVKDVREVAVVGIPDGQGGERVAALAIAEALTQDRGEDDEAFSARRHLYLSSVQSQLESARRKLDEKERPGWMEVDDEALPRTADLRVKRPEVIARIVSRQQVPARPVSNAIQPNDILGASAQSAGMAKARLRAPGHREQTSLMDGLRGAEAFEVAKPVRDALRQVLTKGQMAFYDSGMKVQVAGEHHIPHNRQTIVASNHASHLDMGLIKYALGSYGQELVALAAKDYFFEGKWRRTYFENFTNLRPLDRADNPREAMREASGLLEKGRTILLFPEGTRTTSGEMASFRPSVAYLALKHGVDILPVYVDGTYRSMPRGAFVPKNRRVSVRIGSPISAEILRSAADETGMKLSAACVKCAAVVQQAVEALRDDQRFDLQRVVDEIVRGKASASQQKQQARHPLEELFSELEGRFQPDEVKSPLTYYFSLGQGPETKWTVQVEAGQCRIFNGKADQPADCVMKTDVQMFTRIVREHYIPQVGEFLDGTVKTNDPELLTAFVQLFNL